MTEKPHYTEFHPRWHRTRVSTYWWLERPTYLLFILRELSSIFVGWFVVFFLMLIGAVARGEAAYERFQEFAERPLVMLLNVVSLIFVVYHAVTWFNLAPQALVLRYKGKRVPATWIAGSNYAAWVVVSIVVAWIILGGD